MLDMTTLTDSDLRQVREASTLESDRRDVLARTPASVAMLARQYATAGGDLADLHAALDSDPDEGA